MRSPLLFRQAEMDGKFNRSATGEHKQIGNNRSEPLDVPRTSPLHARVNDLTVPLW